MDNQQSGNRAEDDGQDRNICEYVYIFFSLLCMLPLLPLIPVLTLRTVQEYERAVIFRLGRLVSGEAKGPGLFFIIPCIDEFKRVDLRTQTYDIPPQEILTKDSVTVAVDAVVYYRIQNAISSLTNVENVHLSTGLLAQSTLRNTLGTKSLAEILSQRDEISDAMQASLDQATDPWGVKVERVELKDVRLPVQLQRAMAAEAEADKEAKAKIIAAQGEQDASKALKHAADVIQDCPAALQLRYLQTLNSVGSKKNDTIIFPLPLELLRTMMRATPTHAH
ncbi:band 7 protein AAEL010189-like [Liolophura sinensis]|uniref:band 7 protein AAEL010189-like n=1 Tax=Liolophura sinensis TaxID=3198878 RepID=UPI0031581C0F